MATNKTTAVNQDVRLREWSAQLEAQQSSGMTVPEWCAANGIKTKSFYYHLRKVRVQLHSMHIILIAIVRTIHLTRIYILSITAILLRYVDIMAVITCGSSGW